MHDDLQFSSLGGGSLSSLPISFLSDTSPSWMDASHESLLKNSSSSMNLFDISLYLSFLRSKRLSTNTHNSTAFSEFSGLGLSLIDDGSFSFRSDNISQLFASNIFESSLLRDDDENGDDDISLLEIDNTFVKKPLNSVSIESSSIMFGKNPLNYYESLPASLKGSGTSLSKFKKFLTTLKSSHKHHQPYLEYKAIGCESSSFLNDDFSIEKSKNVHKLTNSSKNVLNSTSKPNNLDDLFLESKKSHTVLPSTNVII